MPFNLPVALDLFLRENPDFLSS